MASRDVTVNSFQNRKSIYGTEQTVDFVKFFENDCFKNPAKDKDTQEEYQQMTKDQQGELKDKGCFLIGKLLNGRRTKSCVLSRDAVMLDYDHLTPVESQKVICSIEPYTSCYYTTRSSTKDHPRLRVIILLDRSVTPVEYEPVARMLVKKIGTPGLDVTTFEIQRIFFYASICTDGLTEYKYKVNNGSMACADDLLKCYTDDGKDWHDPNNFPRFDGEDVKFLKIFRGNTQQDPCTKTGWVGAFCRIYDIYRVLDEIIPGLYIPSEIYKNRFTYKDASTADGFVIYDSGSFAYSFHESDPIRGKLVNSFDLVRLVCFGSYDDKTSYAMMLDYIMKLPEVVAEYEAMRREEVIREFGDIDKETGEPPLSVFHHFNKSGIPTQPIDSRIEDYIIRRYNIFVSDDKIFIYVNGVYTFDSSGKIITDIIRRLIYPDLVTAGRLGSICALLKKDIRIERSIDDVNLHPVSWINFQNGMLDVLTEKLYQHNPEYFSLNQIPWNWNPDAAFEGTAADRFYKSWIKDDKDRHMHLAYKAYMMTVYTGFQKFEVLIGEKGVGKSEDLTVTREMLGPQNCSSVSLHDFNTNRFVKAPLLGKLANIFSDLPGTEMKETSTFRQLTGEDVISAERKFENPFSFFSYAKQLFSCNEMPLITEEDPGAFYRRVLAIKIDKQGDYIPNIKQGLRDSIPGLIVECVRALKPHLMFGKDYLPLDSPNSTALVRELEMKSDPVKAFIEDCVTVDADGKSKNKVEATIIYSNYKMYCSENRMKSISNHAFYDRLGQMGYSKRKSNGKYYIYGLSMSKG